MANHSFPMRFIIIQERVLNMQAFSLHVYAGKAVFKALTEARWKR